MSEIIHHNPKLPRSIRADMLRDGPGAEFKWEGRKFEVVRDRDCGVAIVEVDRFESESRGAGRGHGEAPKKSGLPLASLGVMAGVAVGGVCLATAAFATTNSGSSAALVTALAVFAATGIGYLVTHRSS